MFLNTARRHDICFIDDTHDDEPKKELAVLHVLSRPHFLREVSHVERGNDEFHTISLFAYLDLTIIVTQTRHKLSDPVQVRPVPNSLQA